MPRVTPARSRAREATPDSSAQIPLDLGGIGACVPCHDQGVVTLAVDPVAGSVCAFHLSWLAGDGPRISPSVDHPLGLTGSEQALSGPAQRPAGGAGRGPRGRRARTERRAEQRRRTRLQVIQDAQRRARALRRGRAAAAARVNAGTYAVHPGWRNFLPPGWREVTSQVEALQLVVAVIADQPWRRERIVSSTTILRTLIDAMDWRTGVISAVTSTRLAAAADRSHRTVTRVIAWAQDAGILICLEGGATAACLGSDTNRTPSYAVITNTPLPNPEPEPEPVEEPLVTPLVHDLGDPPQHTVGITTRTRRLEPTPPVPHSWPLWQIPQTPVERTTAARRLGGLLGLGEAMLDQAGRCRLPRWWALLRPWWDTGWCPAGLAWAIDHHPDAPDRYRGDALAGATDPIAVLGARLRPWRDHAGELPAHLLGQRGNYLAVQAAELTRRLALIDTAAAAHRAAEQAALGIAEAATAALHARDQHRATTEPGHNAQTRSTTPQIAPHARTTATTGGAGTTHRANPSLPATSWASDQGRAAARELFHTAEATRRARRPDRH